MIFKVFYQKTKVSPRREQTQVLYVQVDAADELQGRIKVKELVENKFPAYNVEFVDLLSDKHLEYEKEHADFKLTEF
ncbi:DNA-dependent RNA polymerase auxiliary subunit epsilon family protein [Streptococcus suis]|nr:DNA-dependent RNA polymerase auxiliary subunit epsilon family protein [Streptococcus suis]